MPSTRILLPAFALVLLTCIVWLHMYYVRLIEMRRNNVSIEQMTPFNRALTPRLITSGDNLRNLFELPVLFYFFSVLIFMLHLSDTLYLALAWVFVLLRYLHSAIHVTYNRIAHRFAAYALSSLLLWAIAVRLFVQMSAQA
jgi:hypothetical protein